MFNYDNLKNKKGNSNIFTSTYNIKKFSKYKIHEEKEEGEAKSKLFIVPDDKATIQEYPFSIFDFYPDILKDFVAMAQKVHRNSQENSAPHILNFCNRYGLFNISGYYADDFATEEIKEDEGPPIEVKVVKLKSPGFDVFIEYKRNKETISDIDYANFFFPKSLPIYEIVTPRSDKLHQSLLNNYYAEPVSFLVDEISNLYSKFVLWYDFYRSNEKHLHQSLEFLSCRLMTSPLRVTVDLYNAWQFKWEIDNLIDALNIMLIMNIVETKNRILICHNDNCKMPFIAGNKDKTYCSHHCSLATRQRRHYYKKKEG